MKRIHCAGALLSIFLGGALHAQVWAPAAATWYYDWSSFGPFGYAEMHSPGDTLVGGAMCSDLLLTVHAYDPFGQIFYDQPLQHYYTHVNGDLVSIWNGAQFDTLFWFGATPGAQWDYPLALVPGPITVNDTGSINLSGSYIHFLTVTLPEGSQDTLFELLGSRQFFMDHQLSMQMDASMGALRCYTDFALSYSTGISPECDFILGFESHGAKADGGVFPNPTSDWIQFAHPSSQTSIGSIIDVNGRTLFTGDVNKHDRLNIAFLAPGYYMLRLSDRHGATLYHAPFMKE